MGLAPPAAVLPRVISAASPWFDLSIALPCRPLPARPLPGAGGPPNRAHLHPLVDAGLERALARRLWGEEKGWDTMVCTSDHTWEEKNEARRAERRPRYDRSIPLCPTPG